MKNFLTLLFLMFTTSHLFGQPMQKHRVVILSDIEAEPDDIESFVRLVLYSNVIDIKGMVATTSIWKKTSVAPEPIRKVIRAYGKVQPNLLKHEAGFPEASALLAIVKEGLPVYGMEWAMERTQKGRIGLSKCWRKRTTALCG